MPATLRVRDEKQLRQILAGAKTGSPRPAAARNAKKCYYLRDGATAPDLYDSTAEASHARGLDAQLRIGEIAAWDRQVKLQIRWPGSNVWIVTWHVDFLVTYRDGRREYHDVKGYPNDRWPMLRKLTQAAFPDIPLRVFKG